MDSMFRSVTQRLRMRPVTGTKQAAGRLVVAIMALLILMAVPATSYASADGYAYWGRFPVNIGGQSVSVPAGQLYHAINGSGRHINWQAANFGVAGNLCDSSVRFTYGWGSHKLDGNVHRGCSAVGQWKYRLNWDAPGGDACAELWAKNWRVLVAKQCHYIH